MASSPLACPSKPVSYTHLDVYKRQALERATVSVAQIIITAVITGIGTTAVAANHLAVTAESISYLPAYGLSLIHI